MRTVIYDAEDMEPITVIDVPQHFMREIETGKRGPELCFAIPPKPLSAADFSPNEPSSIPDFRSCYVRVRFEPIYKGRERMMWLATTMDGETALLLRSTFLPGQRGAVERERQDAFMAGLMRAVRLA